MLDLNCINECFEGSDVQLVAVQLLFSQLDRSSRITIYS